MTEIYIPNLNLKTYISHINLKRIAEEIFDLDEGDLRNRGMIGTAWDEIDYHDEEKIRKVNRENIFNLLQNKFKELLND